MPGSAASAGSGYAIGIDLGTTYSCVGVWQDDRVQIIPTADGARTFPSYVAFTSTSLLTGHAAKQQAHLNPANTVFDSKRLIGRRFDDPITQADIATWPFSVVPASSSPSPLIMVQHRGSVQTYTAEQVSSFVLAALKAQAEAFLHGPVTDAVITVPAYFSDAQRAATKDAGAIAGLNVLRVINEPTAAAIAYGLERGTAHARNVLIFDLGGGTFDVSLLSIEDGVFEVRATAGDTHLGGEDFDAAIMEWVIAQLIAERAKRGLRLRDDGDKCVVRGDDKLLRRLRTACEQAKREVSTLEATTITLTNVFPPSAQPTSLSLAFTRERLEALCGPLFRSTLLPVEQVLRDAKLDKASVHDLVLVGGSTRIPYIQRLLSDYFQGKALSKDIDPDEAVAYGAAVQAAILTGKVEGGAASSILLIDVVPMSLGLEVAGGVMNTLIPRNSTIPCRRVQSFTTHEDMQSCVEVRVYEGERLLTKDNLLLGTFDISGLPLRPRGALQLEVTFDVDVDGIMHVTAIEKDSGVGGGIVVSSDRGLSGEELRGLMEEVEETREADEREAARVRSKAALQGWVLEVGRRMDDDAAQAGLDDKERDGVKRRLREVDDWIAAMQGGGDEEQFEHKQRELETHVMPVLIKAGMLKVTRRPTVRH